MLNIKQIISIIVLAAVTVFFVTGSLYELKENADKNRRVTAGENKSEPELNYYAGSIASGRTIYQIFKDRSVAHSEIMNLIKSFGKVYDLRKVRENQKYSILLTKQNEIKEFSYNKDPLNKFVAERDGDRFRVYKKDVKYDKKVVAKKFIITDSLYNSIVSQDETTTLVNKIADIFSWDIDFYLDPKKGDEIKILFEKIYKGKTLVKYGNILSMQYITKRKTFQAFYFQEGKVRGYYDEKGRPLRKMFLKLPLKFGRITSKYSIRRFHPVDKRYKAHKGIDYGAPTGTPIFATADGRVSYSGWSRGYGKLVVVKNKNGYKTYYGHCSRLLVRKGKRVRQGQMIAKVGRTGKATGPHVHYEIRYKNRAINPSTIKTSKGKPIGKNLHAKFLKLKESRLGIVELLLKNKMKLYISGNKLSSNSSKG